MSARGSAHSDRRAEDWGRAGWCDLPAPCAAILRRPTDERHDTRMVRQAPCAAGGDLCGGAALRAGGALVAVSAAVDDRGDGLCLDRADAGASVAGAGADTADRAGSCR